VTGIDTDHDFVNIEQPTDEILILCKRIKEIIGCQKRSISKKRKNLNFKPINPKDIKTLRKTHVSFAGSPKMHPYDTEKVILVADPYSTQNTYYEFYKNDVSYVEEMPNIVDQDGQAVTMVRIWIKKLSIGVRCSPFVVNDIGNLA
jgi:inorganic pyrophosphatase